MIRVKHLFSLLLFLTTRIYSQKTYHYPETFKQNTIDTIWNKIVYDPYRWLENIHSAETNDWLNAQEKIKNKYEGISYYSLLKYLPAYYYQNLKPVFKSGKYFFYYQLDDFNQPLSLYYRKSETGEPEILFNPKILNNSGVQSIKDISLSDDNQTLALLLSENGGDWETIRFLNMENKKLYDDTVNFVKYSSLFWCSNKIYYVRYDVSQTAESFTGLIKGRSLFCHTLGTKQMDDQVIYKPNNDFEDFNFKITPEKKYLVLYHHKEQGNKRINYVSYMHLPAVEQSVFKDFIISKREDEYYNVLGEENGMLLVQTNLNAPTGAIYKYNPDEINQGDILIHPYEERLEYSKIMGNKIITIYNDNRQSFSIICDTTGKQLHLFNFPEGYSFSGFSGSIDDSMAYFSFNSFYDPPSFYKINLITFEKKPFSTTYIYFNNKDLITEKIYYYSRDSTLIPMYLTHKKNIKLNGNNPTILYGYGGFGISMEPFYSPANIIFLKNDGVLAVPCLRGGGDFPGWHEKGKRLNKQNTFDDFIYAAEYLISKKYTNTGKIAAMGGSNGGLLVGACMVQRPDLFKVVVSESGLLDMLRYHMNNITNLWKSEYGDVTDSLDFNNLFNYSPVQNVKPGIDYPATLLVASDNDDRVLPFHSFKFLAALQAKGTSQNPYVLYYQHQAGHSGSSIYQKIVDKDAYVYSFIFKNLGIEWKIKYDE